MKTAAARSGCRAESTPADAAVADAAAGAVCDFIFLSRPDDTHILCENQCNGVSVNKSEGIRRAFLIQRSGLSKKLSPSAPI